MAYPVVGSGFAASPLCALPGIILCAFLGASMTSADDNMLATLSRIGAVAPEVIELFDYLEDTPLWMKDEAGHYQWANVAFLLNFGVKTREPSTIT